VATINAGPFEAVPTQSLKLPVAVVDASLAASFAPPAAPADRISCTLPI